MATVRTESKQASDIEVGAVVWSVPIWTVEEGTDFISVRNQICVFAEHSHSDPYKKFDLKVTNFESEFSKKAAGPRNKRILKVSEKNLLNKDAPDKKVALKAFVSRDETKGDIIFQRSMRGLLVCGQLLGLNPFIGVFEDDPKKIRFTFFSLRFLYSMLMLIYQTACSILWWHRMFEKSVTIHILGHITFYGATGMTTYMFIKVARKWSSLVQDVSDSALEEYMDPRIRRKCNIATFVIMIFAMMEHCFALISSITNITDCSPNTDDIFEAYIKTTYSLMFRMGVPYSFSIGVLIQMFNITTTISWNYADLFIICMSFYLTSILVRINKKIISAKERYSSLEFWRSMREDYTRATKLIRAFDDVISGVIFVSLADNLFFTCLQLLNVLSNGLRSKSKNNFDCPNYPSGPFYGYEQPIYFYYSFSFILARSLIVSLIAANVHSAAIMIAPALYEIPSSVYCDEIQRFIDQVHNDKVAFSALKFFYVTKELILSVAGAVVTYELVLLQFNGDNKA